MSLLNKMFMSLVLISGVVFTQHFDVTLNVTGESQPIIITADVLSAAGLEGGDEVGIFDGLGLLSGEDPNDNPDGCSSEVGELLVGAGEWDGSSTMPISAIGSIDNCSLPGGTQLPGYVEGNWIGLRVWDASAGVEYTTEYTTTGDYTFGSALVVLTSITLVQDGDILGCTDDTACNYNADATVDDGSCAVNDCAGECGGDAVEDCAGECGGVGVEYSAREYLYLINI